MISRIIKKLYGTKKRTWVIKYFPRIRDKLHIMHGAGKWSIEGKVIEARKDPYDTTYLYVLRFDSGGEYVRHQYDESQTER